MEKERGNGWNFVLNWVLYRRKKLTFLEDLLGARPSQPARESFSTNLALRKRKFRKIEFSGHQLLIEQTEIQTQACLILEP